MEIPKVKNKYREMYFYSAPLASYSTTASAQRLTTTHQFLGVSGWTLFSWSMPPPLAFWAETGSRPIFYLYQSSASNVKSMPPECYYINQWKYDFITYLFGI